MGKLDKLRAEVGAVAAENAGHGVDWEVDEDGGAGSVPGGRLVGTRGDPTVLKIDITRIVSDPDQPRKVFDADRIGELTASVCKYGVLQPIRVRWDAAAAKYVIIAGERRWRAAFAAGLDQLPCVVAGDGMGPGDVLAQQLIENCVRTDLSPIEQANAFRRLMALKGWTGQQLATELHLHKATVSRTLALLDLPEEIQRDVDAGVIKPAVAVELGQVRDLAQREALAAKAKQGGLRRDDVRQARRTTTTTTTAPAGPEPEPAPVAGPPPVPQPAPAAVEAVTYEVGDAFTVVVQGPAARSRQDAVRAALERALGQARTDPVAA